MKNFVEDMLHNSPAAKRLHDLWLEYEDQQTPEARFVKGEYGNRTSGEVQPLQISTV